ncbi:Hypothetical protein NTJ_05599 [Nesidiocoris tenuis]|uniref:Uncharacterized protein n=1 Tax=Nesidiocoris tenuis TaxID=355587 RepID=A0ABN7APH4_9HEMI|nr:Hypothetical protein NTJ_05599 [Nesidiocoris tenuis]
MFLGGIALDFHATLSSFVRKTDSSSQPGRKYVRAKKKTAASLVERNEVFFILPRDLHRIPPQSRAQVQNPNAEVEKSERRFGNGWKLLSGRKPFLTWSDSAEDSLRKRNIRLEMLGK